MWNLRPGSEVGVVCLPELTVEIGPKLPVDRVMFLISYSLGRLNLPGDVVDISHSPDLVEAMIQMFHAAVRQATRRGLLHDYRTREDTLNVVRGRIRIEEQLRRRFGIPVPIEVRYDEFTPDIEANRLLKAAVRHLAWLPQRSPVSRRLLSTMRAVFVNVSDVEYQPTHLPDVPVNPLNVHYQPALALARLILTSGTVELAVGNVESASFLINMNQVFEDFVVVGLREALRLTPYEFPQGTHDRRLWLDTNRRVRLEPDISWWEDNRCVFVGDAKYKRTTVHGAQNHDIYQVLAYAVAAGLPSALLIYAHGEDNPMTYDIQAADKRIEVAVLDLRGETDALLKRVKRLVWKVRQHKAESPAASLAA